MMRAVRSRGRPVARSLVPREQAPTRSSCCRMWRVEPSDTYAPWARVKEERLVVDEQASTYVRVAPAR